MADVVANSRDEESQCFVGADECRDWRPDHFRRWVRPGRIRRERADMDEEIECRLENVYHVTEIMIGNKAIICSSACDKEANELV